MLTLHVLLSAVSGPKQSALALHDLQTPTDMAPAGSCADPAGTPLTVLHRWYIFPPPPKFTFSAFHSEQPGPHVQLLSNIEIVPGVVVDELKLTLFWIQLLYPGTEVIVFPFHRTQLLFPMTRGAFHPSVTGGYEVDVVPVKLLFVTTMYDQPSTVIALT